MAARYWVLASDVLMEAGYAQWPPFLRPVERGSIVWLVPGVRWWLFEDDEAPAELDGKQVELHTERRDGQLVILRREQDAQAPWSELAAQVSA
jgi:hypothetical protein